MHIHDPGKTQKPLLKTSNADEYKLTPGRGVVERSFEVGGKEKPKK